MSRPHDLATAGKLRQFVYTAWVRQRNSQDDQEVPRGETRPPDHVLQLEGLRLEIAFRGGRAVIIDESGIPVPIMDFIDRARLERRRVYGVLISTKED
jgi:hypothetical protein